MAGVVAVVLIAAVFAAVAAIWWRSHTKFVESRKEHWFKAFAAERGGTFDSGVPSDPRPVPSFGVSHPDGRPLAGSTQTTWVEFRHRDRAVIAVDAQEPYRHFDDHTYFRDIHVVQVRVPPSPAVRITAGQGISTPDSRLQGELSRWLAANPRFAQRDVVVEHGSARTWGRGCATRQNIVGEAGYLADLAERLPATLWTVSGGAS